MKEQKTARIAGVLLLLAASTYGQAYTPYFSVVNGGPSGLPGDNIYTPGPTPYLPGNNAFEVDALSGNHLGFYEEWVFSVDASSVGVVGTAVNQEATAPTINDHPADIYRSAVLSGNNTLDWDGDGIPNPLNGSMGVLGLIEQPPGDDVDGLEIHGFPTNAQTAPIGAIYYSLDQASAGGLGFDGATLFMDPAVPGYDVPTLFATSAQLGLQVTDDIDAIVVYDMDQDGTWSAGDMVDFSLTAASPTAGGLGADIFRTSFGGGPTPLVSANALGLLPTDNVDALDVIPEPSSVLLLTIGGVALLKSRRYFRS